MYSAPWNDSVRPSEEAHALRGIHLEKGKMRAGRWTWGFCTALPAMGLSSEAQSRLLLTGGLGIPQPWQASGLQQEGQSI